MCFKRLIDNFCHIQVSKSKMVNILLTAIHRSRIAGKLKESVCSASRYSPQVGAPGTREKRTGKRKRGAAAPKTPHLPTTSSVQPRLAATPRGARRFSPLTSLPRCWGQGCVGLRPARHLSPPPRPLGLRP